MCRIRATHGRLEEADVIVERRDLIQTVPGAAHHPREGAATEDLGARVHDVPLQDM